MQKTLSKTPTWEIDQYAALIDKILHHGEKRETRAGPAYSLFGETLTVDVYKEFPLLRGRKMFYKPVLGELAAFFRGPKHIEDFKKFGCNYWDAWGEKEKHQGDNIVNKDTIGNINVDYGNSWINFNGVNQLENLINTIRQNPTDRRLLISGWRPDNISQLSLPCCHLLYQWYVRDSKYLDMVWYQRSVDTMVGLPSDIILAACWNILLANETGYTPGTCKFFLGDTHIYANHLQPTLEYLRQLQASTERGSWNSNIEYQLFKDSTCSTFIPEHITVTGYNPQPGVKFELNV